MRAYDRKSLGARSRQIERGFVKGVDWNEEVALVVEPHPRLSASGSDPNPVLGPPRVGKIRLLTLPKQTAV